MTRLVVSIAEQVVSNNPEDVLITYALGSCIAVVLHDPTCLAGGMIHYMLPLSSTNPEKAKLKPAMFADTGVPLLFHAMYSLGCKKSNLIVKVIGGGQLYDDHETVEIGKRNITVLRRMLWKTNVLIAAEDVGGQKSRTVSLDLASGQCIVKSQNEEVAL
ncbi:MAG TPA: chemotaxis protein CheD [Polyangiaceae bacterium]